MRILFLIIVSLLISNFVSAQSSASSHDQIIRQAADHVGIGQYEEALSALDQLESQKRQGLIDERFYYFSIKARYQRLVGNRDQTYDNIQAIRALSQLYLEKFKTGKRTEIADISKDISHYPKTVSEYDDWLIEQRRLIFERKQTETLAVVEKSYHAQRYDAVVQWVEEARQEGISSHKFDYYEILAKNEIFQSSKQKDFRSVEGMHRLIAVYLSSNNLDETDRAKIEQIFRSYPKTLDDFNAMLASERLAALTRAKGEKLSDAHAKYHKGNYEIVMQITDTFEPGSEMAASFAYLQAMSAYKYLLSKKDTYFSQIVAADVLKTRNALSAYKHLYGNSQPENRRQVDIAVVELNKTFGSNEHQFEKLKKKVLAHGTKAIRRSQSNMFISIGYEYGEIAPYGLRFEVGGRSIGFFATIRSSMIKSQTVYDAHNRIANKDEVIAGPNIKLANWLFWNIGAGYGYFLEKYHDIHSNERGVQRSNYVSGYTGVTLRASPIVNFIGGASFMDIAKKYSNQYKKPEYTIGITFNFK